MVRFLNGTKPGATVDMITPVSVLQQRSRFDSSHFVNSAKE
ncbi:hypothetical protein RSSM_04022 [Rhodopirellula sallentina SM41]|uniref:Uncharacterized protein n=1 Tax=Rhodopirellula sallentina SM41 TaxID=1263870 RepID=M5U9M2_9BACT|nr:hypothetical protein RSSM_04022 [Rhodopirellula sallentina SM41]